MNEVKEYVNTLVTSSFKYKISIKELNYLGDITTYPIKRLKLLVNALYCVCSNSIVDFSNISFIEIYNMFILNNFRCNDIFWLRLTDKITIFDSWEKKGCNIKEALVTDVDECIELSNFIEALIKRSYN